MFRTRFVEEIKTHLIFNKVFFFENRAVCEIMWNNIVGQDRTQWDRTGHRWQFGACALRFFDT